MTKLLFLTNTVASISETTYDGKPYLIAPVVMIREGVLNDILYLTEEISRYVEAWNGRAVPLSHPMRAGVYVSANAPDIWAGEVPGFLFNTLMDGDRLKSEIWIDLEKAEKIGEPALDVVERLRAGEPIEVSTGLFADLEETAGTWNGKSYIGIARNIRPDHLALLPNEIGACSWEDGCGTPRVNQKGAVMGDEVKVNELTLDDRAVLVRRAFWEQVGRVDPDDWYLGDWDVLSVFGTTLIAKDWKTKTHTAFPYTMNEAGEVVFGEPTPVDVVYRAKEGGVELVIANADADSKPIGFMARALQWFRGEKPQVAALQQEENDEVAKKCDLVATLVANKAVKFSREELERFDEGTLQKLNDTLAVNSNEQTPAPTAQTTPANNQAAAPALDPAQLTEMIRGVVNEAFGPALQAITANADREKTALVAGLVANEQCQVCETTLKAMSVETLRELASSFQVRDYSGGAGFIPNTSGNEEYVMEMPKPKEWVVAGEGN